jgi:uncharacterized RDD family membrane protein YckC
MTDHYTPASEVTADAPQTHANVWRSEIHARVAGYRRQRGRRIEGNFSMPFPFPSPEAAELMPEQSVAAESMPEQSSAADEDKLTVNDDFSVAALINAVPEELSPLSPAAETEIFRNEEAETSLASIVEEPLPKLCAAEPARLAPSSSSASSSASVARPRPRRKVIAFPRQASAAPDKHNQLADPVIADSPRILDVPEELEAIAAPLFDGLQLSSAQNGAANLADHIDLPLPAVAISQRLCAGLIDCAMVAAAATVFGLICYEMLPKLVLNKPILLALGAAVVVLWSAYEYIFTVYNGATPGMCALRMQMRTFQGGSLSWLHRRSRVFALYFSSASLMMGLLWALVDVDTLCWHDRISRTFITRRD